MSAFLLWVSLLGVLSSVENLHQLGRQADQQQIPIVIYISRTGCTFCQAMERDILGPLMKSGALDGKALIRELRSDDAGSIVGFDGKLTTPQVVAQAYDAQVTPMFLFVDGAGAELHPRIVGYNPSVYYSYYLERAVKQLHANR